METNDKNNYLFFIRLNKELPPYYLRLATIFSNIGIKLIPISPTEFSNLQQNRVAHTLIITSDFESMGEFKKMRHRYFDIGLRNGRYSTYHCSSFSTIDKDGQLAKNGYYNFYSLPLKLDVLVASIAIKYFEKFSQNNTWPGGRRAKLPADVNGN